MTLRAKYAYDQSMRIRRLRRYTHVTARYITESIVQPSFVDQVLLVNGVAVKPTTFKCTLCGRSRNICPAYECMPERLQRIEDDKWVNKSPINLLKSFKSIVDKKDEQR